MAFDINSAQEAPAGGFDISSAQDASQEEVSQQNATNWYANRFGSPSDLLEGTKAAGAALGDIIGGIGKIPVQVAAASMGKLVRPDLSLNELWKASGEEMEAKVPSFGSTISPEAQTIYQKEMYPVEVLGKIQEGLGELAGEATGSPDIAGAVKMGLNFAPIPIGKGVAKLSRALKPEKPSVAPPVESLDNVLDRHAEAKQPEPAPTPKEWEKTNESQQMELFDQPEQGRTANPYEASIGEWRVDENGIPIRADLSMEAQHLQEPLQRQLWGEELPPRVAPVGQAATLAEGVRQFQEQPIQGGIPLTHAIDAMDPAARRAALAQEFPGPVEASGALDAAVMEANSPFRGLRGSQAGAMDVQFIDNIAKQGKEALERLRKVAWDKFWTAGSDYNGPEYLDIKLINDRIFALEKQERIAAGLKKQTLGEVAPGYTIIPTGTKVMARHGITFSEPTMATVIGHKDMRFEDGPYRLAVVDFGDGRGRTILPGDISTVYAGPTPFKGLGRGQAGALDMKIFDPLYEKVKDIADGFKLVFKGDESFPTVYAYNPRGEKVGTLQLTADDYINPNPQSSLKAAWVDTRGAPGKQLAEQMYKFAASQNADIIPSHVQTAAGREMWNRFTQSGTAMWNNKQGSVIPRNQRGGVDIKAIQEGLKSTLPATGKLIPREDSLLHPISAGNVEKKLDLAAKADAIKLSNTPYQRVTTREEALANLDDQKDMSAAGVNSLRSGSEAVARTNVKNKVLNYTRNLYQEARNNAEKLSKQYITAPKTGLVARLKELSPEEEVFLSSVIQRLSQRQIEYTDAIANDLGLNTKQQAAARAFYDAMDARYASAADAMQSLGFEPMRARKGYAPSMFSGSYMSFIGHYRGDKFITTGIAQADTLYGLNKAVEKYKTMGPEYSVELRQPKRELRTSTSYTSRVYDGFNDLVSELAKSDPAFAEAKRIVDQHVADQVRGLYRFDLHEIQKKGVRGALGDRPWLDAKQNARDFFTAAIDYAEQGFRYDSMQKPLNEAAALAADPVLIEKMPNTVKYLKAYSDKILGNDLNAVGALGNAIVNRVSLGISPHLPGRAVRALSNISSGLMMGWGNLGFAAMQMSQLPLQGFPEALAVRSSLKLPPEAMSHSLTTAPMYTVLMALGKKNMVPTHLQRAYDWAHEVGMFEYSEAELAHEVHKSKAQIIGKKIINAPIIYSEKLTRPPIFMSFADMFHKAGYVGEDALLRAQEATDYAMTNYHADERPGIYSGMGQLGHMLGALSTYKHNFIEQGVSRTLNAKQHPAALAATLGAVLGFYGIAGLPGYQEMSQISEKLLGKSIREFLMEDPTKANTLMDGAASAYSGIDIQSRLSQSSMFPDSALSAAPHVANMTRILGAAYDAGINKDTASWNALASAAMPGSMRNVFEDKVMTDQEGYIDKEGVRRFNVRDTSGKIKTEQGRTEEERRVKRLTGMVPLQERLQRETLWTQKQRETKRQQDLKDISKRFENALVNGDRVDTIVQDYVAKGGDPNQLLSQAESIMKKANMTPKQRAQGEPSGSLSSMYRYQGYND